MSVRTDKVASVIKRAITEPIDNLAKEHHAGLVTVTSVVLSKDLQIAKVYISIYANKIEPGKFLAILEDKKGWLRSYIGSHVIIRHTPELRFFYDDTLEQMNHIQELIDSVKTTSKDVNVNMDDYDDKYFPK
jgi:ribosome-binding factor A